MRWKREEKVKTIGYAFEQFRNLHWIVIMRVPLTININILACNFCSNCFAPYLTRTLPHSEMFCLFSALEIFLQEYQHCQFGHGLSALLKAFNWKSNIGVYVVNLIYSITAAVVKISNASGAHASENVEKHLSELKTWSRGTISFSGCVSMFAELQHCNSYVSLFTRCII